ncbi:phage holin family protein [Limosilactobacillus sp. pH52_RY]|uniref:phage holin family protein n=1 Tax=Limosilactobacillus balticus TaxID=2759747 RepID=UPI0015F91E43|nr:phage holin family protein [Limosilactobacillus balticus]MBB1110020.1 phage holin family protein [Limosilactobacillus balticus]
MHLLLMALPYHEVALHQAAKQIDDPLIVGFTLLVLFDIGSGIVKGLRSNRTATRTNSTKGTYGLARNFIITIGVLMFYPYLITIGFDYVAQMMVLYFCYQYLVSIVENLKQMDIQVPWLSPVIDSLAKVLNVAKAQPDYNAQDFHPITGTYRGKDKEEEK